MVEQSVGRASVEHPGQLDRVIVQPFEVGAQLGVSGEKSLDEFRPRPPIHQIDRLDRDVLTHQPEVRIELPALPEAGLQLAELLQYGSAAVG